MKLSNYSIVVILSALLMITGCAGKNEAEAVKPADMMYDRASRLLNKNNFELAAERYIELIRSYPYGTHTTQARLEIAYAYYKNGDTDKAIAAVDEFINFYPEHPHIDYAYYLKGLIHLPIQAPKFGERFFTDQETFSDHAAASARESFKAFKEVTQRFPFSEYSDASQQNMVDLINVLRGTKYESADFTCIVKPMSAPSIVPKLCWKSTRNPCRRKKHLPFSSIPINSWAWKTSPATLNECFITTFRKAGI